MNKVENRSGITPLEYRVLIQLVKKEHVTAGGIVIPEDAREREQAAETRARVVALGGMAFEDWKDARLPKPGDAVLVGKYSGQIHKGNDGEDYRLCNDKDVVALLD